MSHLKNLHKEALIHLTDLYRVNICLYSVGYKEAQKPYEASVISIL